MKEFDGDINSLLTKTVEQREKLEKETKEIETRVKETKSNIKGYNLRREELVKKEVELTREKQVASDGFKTKLENYIRESNEVDKQRLEMNLIDKQLGNLELEEKEIAKEIESLREVNMIEMQRVEEIKGDIEQKKHFKQFLLKEVEELKEKIRRSKKENERREYEFELKKRELQEKVGKLKENLDMERIEKASDLKNFETVQNKLTGKITVLSLENNSSMTQKNGMSKSQAEVMELINKINN